ncbi:hypothetical protein COV16_01360 [Candidatus Woesearchaeota archaeon CG10_big_fil_rev_8_21_14_0_10_34_8]|nr:MAG: hypothetical protein COV16_01360 [Candidatus Woesearchaeota archaeon CG10_big_fil_rev_8_21_14_0_10_34_8]
MRDEFRKALREIHTVRSIADIFDVIIESIFVFLAIYLFLSLINLYREFAVFPTLIYLAFRAWKVLTEKNLYAVEREHPELKERLRTAADTLHHDNIIVSKLRLSIIKTLRSVKVSSFFHFKELLKKLGYITGISFVIIMVGVYNIQIIDMEGFIGGGWIGLKESLLKGHIADSLLGSSIDSINDDFAMNNLNNVNTLRLQQESMADSLPEDLFNTKSFEETLEKKKRIYIRNYFSKVRNY